MKIAATPNLTVRVLPHQTLLTMSQKGFFIEGEPSFEMLAWFHAYAEKKNPPALPLSLEHFPAFTRMVLAALQKLPFGTCMTYSELAEQIGHPRAPRAVGGACHRNPYPLIIPCHRIISRTHIGGFALDRRIKEELLNFERK